jgi:hypothetical protein
MLRVSVCPALIDFLPCRCPSRNFTLLVVPFDSRIAQCRRQDAAKEIAEKRRTVVASWHSTNFVAVNGNSGRPYPFDYQRRRERRRPFVLIITPSTRCANSKNLIPRGEVSNFFADTIPPKTGSLYNPATIGRFPFQLDRDYISFMKKNCIPLGERDAKRSGINIIIKTCIHAAETPRCIVNKSGVALICRSFALLSSHLLQAFESRLQVCRISERALRTGQRAPARRVLQRRGINRFR